MKKDQKNIDEIQKLDQENGELLLDLQRTRADFEMLMPTANGLKL